MQGFADLSESLLGGVLLLALSLALGGVVWSLAVLEAWRRPAGRAPLLSRAIALIAAGALGVALAQPTLLAARAVVLAESLGRSPFPAYFDTLQCRAGAARTLLALALAVAAVWLRRAPRSRARWALVATLAAGLSASGAFLVHAAGRFGDRAPLMALTTLHQLGAAIWVGGLVQLGAAWRLARRHRELEALWPVLVARFARIGVVAVALLLAMGLPLARAFVGSWQGLVGTGYGSLVLTKAALMAAALGLAALNFTAARRRGSAAVTTRVPYLIEVETIVLVILLFTAASLSSQPPAVDTPGEQATLAEVGRVFAPKWPDLRTPTSAAMQENHADPRVVLGERTATAYSWSNYSHNVSGLVLLAMAVLALAARNPRLPWARHWPLGLVVLAGFVFLRTSGNEGTWPFGDRGFWASTLGDSEVLQHRLAVVLAATLGLLEWRARRTRTPGARLPYLFPALAVMGGILLLTHSHSAFEVKSEFLVQITHTTMGALAVLMACGRLLELRLPPRAANVAGLASTVALLLIALILVFYREANVVVARPETPSRVADGASMRPGA